MGVFIVALVFILALAVQPLVGDGWFWELGNGLGFLALACILLVISNGRANYGASMNHRWLGIFTVIFSLAHGVWFLAGDPASWEYLQWGAPLHMVAGLLAAGL